MSKKYRKGFLQAVEQVLDEIGFSSYKISRKIPKDLQTDFLTTIGFSGDLSGNLLLQSDTQSAHAFVHQAAGHLGVDIEDEKDFGNFHKTTLAEVANQIAGRATILLADRGYDCRITPPTIISGTNVFISSIGMTDSVTRMINGPFGSLRFHTGIKGIKGTEPPPGPSYPRSKKR